MVCEMADSDHKLIVDMRWDETSGVDHPANEEEGWIVMKSADVDVQDLEELIKAEEEFAKAFDALTSALEGTDLSGAPKEVQDAASTLLKWLKEAAYGYGYGYAQPGGDEGKDGGYPKPRVGALQALWDRVRGRVLGKQKQAEAEAAFQKAVEALWPAFCEDVAAIINSGEGTEVRVTKVRERVQQLKMDVGAQTNNDKKEDQ